MDDSCVMTLKKNFEGLMTICQALDNNGLWEKKGINMALSAIFRADIARFMLHLSAADGTLSDGEVQLFQIVTGFSENAEALLQLIRDCRMDSNDFATGVPLSIQVITEAEEKLLARGVKLHPAQSVQALFIGFFQGLGEVLLHSDAGVAPAEQAKLTLCMNTLLRYMQAHNNERYYGGE